MKKIFLSLLFCFISAVLSAEDISGVLNDDNVRVRTLPATNECSQVVTKVYKNQKFKVIAYLNTEVHLDNSEEYWYKICLDENKNQYGWIYGKYLDIQKSDELDCISDVQEFFDEILNYSFNAKVPFCAEPTNESVKSFITGKNPSGNDNIYLRNDDDTEHPFEIEQLIYSFDCGEHKIRKGSWVSTKITKTIPNSFGIKIGMSVAELKNAFTTELKESEYYKDFYYAYVYDVFSEVNFQFENGKLKEIEIYTDGLGN